MRSVRSFLLLVALLAVALPARGHDYWLMPSALSGRAPLELALTLWVGDDYVAEAQIPLQRARTVSFVHAHRGRLEELSAAQPDGAMPVARVRLVEAGGHLFAMERNAALLALPAERFNAYLTGEGLLGPLAERRRMGQLGADGRERYTRYLKALVQVGGARDDGYARVLGHALELVPGRDPATLRPDDTLAVTLLFRGRPLAGALVEAVGRGAAGTVTRVPATTDARGVVSLRLPHDGAWIVRAVHMLRCERCADADWESFWTSYVFGMCSSPGASCAGVSGLTAAAPQPPRP